MSMSIFPHPVETRYDDETLSNDGTAVPVPRIRIFTITSTDHINKKKTEQRPLCNVIRIFKRLPWSRSEQCAVNDARLQSIINIGPEREEMHARTA